VPPATQPNPEQLIELAERALSDGRADAVLEWWRQLGQLVLALAVRTRGWQVNAGGHWVAMMPPESTCMRLVTACRLMHAAPSDPAALAELSVFARDDTAAEPVAETIRALSRAARDWAQPSSGAAREITRALLDSVASVAREFEANGVRQDPLPTPKAGEPDLQMEAVIIGQPSRPRLGQEVSAALSHCEQLAHGLGLGGQSV